MNVIRSDCHEIYTEEIDKIALSTDDVKWVIITDGIHTLGYGHTNLKELYLKITNILVGNVVLPNKPISNVEIIDAAKTLSLYGFRWVFLRDTLPNRAKLNECGILNLYSSSGDGTHWVMWFKKGNDMFNFDSFGVQLLCELISYLTSPTFLQ